MHPVEALLTPLGLLFRRRHADESLSLAHRPELGFARRMAFTSPRFADGEEIPALYCGRFIGDGVSPALSWGDLPAETADLLLVMEDLNSPGRHPRLHAVAAFSPSPAELADGDLNEGSSRARFASGRRGPLSYAGPRPLPGHGPHHYRLHLYALDRALDPAELTDLEHLIAAVDGHVLASATIRGIRES
ncbi:MAG: YbhB/YbcL family Raf kinase inhibitor-like protein [Actinomycetales bacterium]|nr:YbhB/YbcL family Raf kinase inhibitor-like protein [Actinomycetales bacterium]